MNGRSCQNCEWCPEQTATRGTCREGPTPVPVDLDHWCGRFRVAERVIRSGARLSGPEILEHFKPEAPR